MKALLCNGSPRTEGNTDAMLRMLGGYLEERSVSCTYVQIGGTGIHGCTACGTCKELKDRRCIFDDDIANKVLQLMTESDAVILGSPTYFAALTPEMKALIDRTGYVSRANGGMLRRKIGAAAVAVRRAGALNVFQAINNFFLINEMIVPGSTYWNLSLARDPGDFSRDDEGTATIAALAENIAWLLEKTRGES
jgi:multimeric flavodoxin WrbA